LERLFEFGILMEKETSRHTRLLINNRRRTQRPSPHRSVNKGKTFIITNSRPNDRRSTRNQQFPPSFAETLARSHKSTADGLDTRKRLKQPPTPAAECGKQHSTHTHTNRPRPPTKYKSIISKTLPGRRQPLKYRCWR
jgi:hypothetical protein